MAMYSLPWVTAGQQSHTLITVSDVPTFEPNTEGPDYIYVQLADYIAGLISSGVLAPGARLPAERHMADEYGVAYLTVRRAMAELRDRGLIRSVLGRGTFVEQQTDLDNPL